MTTETMQLSASVIDMIREGDLDGALEDVSAAIALRKQAISGEKDFRVGQTVRVVGKLRPNYLFGHEFEVINVNNVTCQVDIPMDSKYRRYSGKKTRIPKTALEIVR